MKIKDIVNRDIVNLTNCDQELIHIPGSIQPHGFLLGLSTDNFSIEFCSGNTFDYIGIPYQDLLRKKFADEFGESELQSIENYISSEIGSAQLKLTLAGKEFNCTINHSDQAYILECEPVPADVRHLSDIYDQTSQFLSYMQSTNSLQQLCGMVTKGMREITGYDRVMVYRFDKDYNGEVFAESVREDLEPFLGLHYPHTDIPPQARELYIKNLLRLIVDINYIPVPIYTIDDGVEKNLDLSLSILRSTSPIHVQYLQNMGVGATLTISLIHQNKLWGLIACHHYSNKNLTPEIRLASQLQGHFITSQIDVRQSNEEYEIARKVNMALEKMNAVVFDPTEESFRLIVSNPEIMTLCNASGVSIVFDGKVFKEGLAPNDDTVLLLSKWLASHTKNTSLYTDRLRDIFSEEENCDAISGINYFSLSSDGANSIIWYRPESLTEVNWAGDPNKAIVKDANGLSPRNSFKLWREIIKCQSNPWLQPEINASANYAHSLEKHVSFLTVSREEEKYRKLSELLKETNSELENINWISTHDLQEPLRKIQLLSSRILSKEGEDVSENVAESIKRMNNSANRMQTLLIDILKYTKIKHIPDSFETIDVHSIMGSTVADLSEIINEKNASVVISELPKIEGISFLLKQLFSNLLLNSIKYVEEGTAPEIYVTALGDTNIVNNVTSDKFYHRIAFTDNGIGFEPQFSESIFNIFNRLHGSEFSGSGVGLALCKKIMQVHKGYIVAHSQLGKGAVFTLYFPV